MKILFELLDLLPKYEEVKNLLKNEKEAAYIIRLVTDNMTNIQQRKSEFETPLKETEEVIYLVHSLADKSWERIHTGHFSEVPLETRKIYSLANYYKIFYLLLESSCQAQVEKCSALLDEAMLIGCTKALYEKNEKLLAKLIQYFNEQLINLIDFELPIFTTLTRQPYVCDVPQIDCPSVEEFSQRYFKPQQPALLLNTITHWPALSKWCDLNYILKVAGNRTVPIEIGSNYATDEWSQQLVKIRDFLKRQFTAATPGASKDIEYLAQHELFDQIPALKADIRIPDYCSLGVQALPVDIKAWLGPQGTISPMHYDPKHNLLCQVFGVKKIILAAPRDTTNLYAHESAFLSNTSQIDAAHVNLERFPLAANVRFYQLTLQAGDCLYMPPKWWHYVRAESESFSVSFWWE